MEAKYAAKKWVYNGPNPLIFLLVSLSPKLIKKYASKAIET